VLKATWHLVYV